MAMTEFEKKMLQEVKGINKELHELNRTLKKDRATEFTLDSDTSIERFKAGQESVARAFSSI